MLNKTILMGRLVRDPELRHTQSNLAVTSFTLAVDRDVKKEGQRDTDFIDCVSWDKKAEFVSKYFHKGQLVAVVGKLQTRKWKDNEGKTRVAFEVVADEVHFAEGKRDNYGTGAAPQQGYGEGRPQGYRPPVSQPANDIPSPDQGFAEIAVDSDTLPF